jgi:hypothetical protein
MIYRYLTTSPGGFIQQLVLHVRNGFRYYVINTIPRGKDPAAVDQKLLSRYEVALSKKQRWARKLSGLACVHYLRYERTQVLLANSLDERSLFCKDHGQHARDVSQVPIVTQGHAVSFRAEHVSVEIDRNTLAGLYRHFEHIAHYARSRLIREFVSLPFERYQPVIRQLTSLVRHTNRLRIQAALPPIPDYCFGRRRRLYRPFDELVEPVGERARAGPVVALARGGAGPTREMTQVPRGRVFARWQTNKLPVFQRWAMAQERCGLSDVDVYMARKGGVGPSVMTAMMDAMGARNTPHEKGVQCLKTLILARYRRRCGDAIPPHAPSVAEMRKEAKSRRRNKKRAKARARRARQLRA